MLPRLLGRAVREAWAWDAYDERDENWYPQGISTSADSSDTEVVGPTAAGCSSPPGTPPAKDGIKRGSRVTFIDLDTLEYRHVLLVVPVFDKAGALQLRPMNIHAGGIVWAGPWLHIAATSRGLRHRAGRRHHAGRRGRRPTRTRSASTAPGWRPSGTATCCRCAATYQAFTDEGHDKLRYSFLSLDRRSDPPALVAGEYAHDPDASTRLARYPLDPATWQLETGEDGFSRPLAIDEGGVRQMQGAVDRGRALPRDRLARAVDAGDGGGRAARLDAGPPLGGADGTRGPRLLALHRPHLVGHRAPAPPLDRRRWTARWFD